jgi:hypothetical protein
MDNIETIIIGDRIIGIDELCDSTTAGLITGLSERTIRDKAVKREFPIYKMASNNTKYLVRDLLEFCETKRIEPSKAA